MSAIHWSIVLAKIDLVSLYFRLLWYHSILKGSIDQYSKIYSPLACSRWLPWFPDISRPYVACVKRGSGETYVRSQSLSSKSAVKSVPTSVPCRAKKDSNIPSPGRTRLVKCPTPGPTKTIKSPPHAPRRHDIDRCINFEPPIPNNTFLSYKSLTPRYVQGNHYKYRESKQYISAEGISWDRNIVLIFYIMTIVKNVWKNVIALNRSSIESFRFEFTANL